MGRDDKFELTSVMRLHALQSMNEEAKALHVEFLPSSNDGTFDITSRPESMSHSSPWVLRIGSK